MVVSFAWLPSASRIREAAAGWPVRSVALGLCIVAMTGTSALLAQPAWGGGEPITALRPPPAGDPARISLGKRLFGDPRLSGNGTIACSSCHDLASGGDDGRAHSIGADGKPLAFNTPTILNVSRNFRLNWRGEFRSIEEQNEAALLDPAVMGADWDGLLRRLAADAGYGRGFIAAYGSSPTRAAVLDALAAFQRSLVTVDSRFDRYLEGEREALLLGERHGYELFKRYGCVACHQGANVGGNLYQRFGIFADPFARRSPYDDSHLGRFAITGRERDRHVFRVPSLRNVALTAPYFHDGRIGSLEDAIRIMARTQLGRELPAADVEAIRRFLETLSGEPREPPAGKASGR
jgi:cytochrome c peroxidase